LLIILILHLAISLFILSGFLDVEADFAHAVVVAHLIRSSLDNNIVLVDGGVDDGAVVDGEQRVFPCGADQCQGGMVFGDAAVVDALERHEAGKLI
jgi:hypothetical protein